jgi:hypothetical protein
MYNSCALRLPILDRLGNWVQTLPLRPFFVDLLPRKHLSAPVQSASIAICLSVSYLNSLSFFFVDIQL